MKPTIDLAQFLSQSLKIERAFLNDCMSMIANKETLVSLHMYADELALYINIDAEHIVSQLQDFSCVYIGNPLKHICIKDYQPEPSL
ncbi:hypothetical protein F7Q91_15755 [Vibrio chagasii]|uniref:Uncharacterized protein n=1 Tax=Vibrio chagasii TaxID=170679 RepID=A0A7V7THU7_9VIBR|nr:hypothetical protein [Vibrio chagasii]KAB0478826.1 hypothetical protein F7Q91_15755 [Vibrio chagasii]